MLLADDTAVGRCSDRKTLLGIRDGQQKFSITSENGLSGPLSEDREGNFYRFASSEIYDRRALIKTNSKGEGIWIMDLRLPIEPKFAMGPDGKIYLLSGSPDGTSLMVIGDPPR